MIPDRSCQRIAAAYIITGEVVKSGFLLNVAYIVILKAICFWGHKLMKIKSLDKDFPVMS